MNKSVSIAIKVIVFGLITGAGIFYVINQSPVESLGNYEKQEMVKPNKTRSVVDQFFSTDSKKRNDAENDDVSLMGSSGRYDEVRIGGKSNGE